MKRARADCRFVDLEAREADEDEEDEEDMDQQGFFEADTVVETPSSSSPARRRSPNIDENSRRKGWNGLVASIEERHASGSGTTNRITEGDHWEENLDPAILAIVQNIIRQPSTDDEYAMWRDRCRTRDPPQAGKWVQVLKGTYKGDIGYVLTTTPSEVLLLLIPRLAPPDVSRLKRKRTETYPIALFNYETAKQDHNIEPIRIDDNIYSVRNDRFEHGLIVKSYDTRSVSEAVSTMSLQYFSRFRESCHPRLTRFPRPSEWCFAEGDAVYIVDDSHPSFYKSGVVSTIRDDSAELDTNEGIICVRWLKICKIIKVGDFVEVTGGMHKGQSGWVEWVTLGYQMADVIRVDKENPQSDRCEMFQVNLNLLRRGTAPVVLGVPPKNPGGAIPQPEQVPWIGTEVVIGRGHGSKGYPGIVKDVLCNQSTPSGLRLVIEITTQNSNAPFRRLTLDFDHVLEARRGVKLHRHILPKSELFMPRTDKLRTSLPPFIHQVPLDTPDTPDIATPATPIPDSCLSSSPAWDPSSRTPQPNSDHAVASPSSPSHPVDPEHPLLDARLVNVGLRVFANGGEYKGKELSVFLMSMEGRLGFCRRKYKTMEYFYPEWVTPKYPSPKRENGLLVVIKGEHFGKYVRRIYHRFEGEEVIAILAVVNRVVGQVDTLTGVQLEMDASHLCVCEEPIEERKRNDLLMAPLRDEARKTRAK